MAYVAQFEMSGRQARPSEVKTKPTAQVPQTSPIRDTCAQFCMFKEIVLFTHKLLWRKKFAEHATQVVILAVFEYV